MAKIYLSVKHYITFTVLLLWSFPVLAQTNLTRTQADKIGTRELTAQMAIQYSKSAASWSAQELSYKQYTMKFTRKIFGTKPAGGRSLYISMHGGGSDIDGKVNDQQWENQKKLYQPKEGVYFVPRSPANTWNMWHDYPMDEFISEIIKAEIVMDDVNPDKVYIMGYSAGGDGAFQLGTRLADYWAAVAMMAGHPGDANILNLKNVPFTAFVGGKDSAYRRNEMVAQWGSRLDSLATVCKGCFIHQTHVYPDMHHWMNHKDTIALSWMATYTRNALPNDIIWVQDDILRDQFYWLGAPLESAKQGDKAEVVISGNNIHIRENTDDILYIYLNDHLLDLDKMVTVSIGGKQVFKARVPRNARIIKETIAMRMDKRLIFSAKLAIKGGRVRVI